MLHSPSPPAAVASHWARLAKPQSFRLSLVRQYDARSLSAAAAGPLKVKPHAARTRPAIAAQAAGERPCVAVRAPLAAEEEETLQRDEWFMVGSLGEVVSSMMDRRLALFRELSDISDL